MIDKKSNVKNDTANLFNDVISKYLPFWPVFALATIVCFGITFLKLRYTTPLYKASATIMLKDEETGMESVIKALEGTESKKNVENEIEIIKSRGIMSQVVVDMGLYAEIFSPGRINNLYSYSNCPVSFKAINPSAVYNTGLINFTYFPSEKAIELSGKKYPLEDTVLTPYGKFRINYQHKNDVKDNRKYFVKFSKVDDMAKNLLSNLTISSGSKQTTILNLGLTDPVPERAVDVLNALIKEYNRAGVADKNTMSQNTLKFIEERLAKVTIELSSIEMDIENYKQREDIVDISTQGSAYLANVQTSDQQLAEVNIQLSVMDNIEKYLINKSDNSGTVPSTFGISDPTLMGLLNKLNDAEMQLSRLRKTGAENSPTVLALQSQISQLKPSILENIRNLKQNLRATESKIRGQSNRYTSMLQTIPKKERELLDINRQQTVKNSIYTFLLEKREETALSYASAAADSRLINPAEAFGFPVKPVKSSMYIFALLCAVLIGVAYVLLKEKLTREIMFRSEIEKQTDATILSEIIFNEGKETIVVNDGNRSPISEQFRSLRTSLGFIGSNVQNKTILMTSSVSGDGKSFIAINLAITLAIANKKVLLLDLDMRKPKLSTMLGLKNEFGMSTILSGNCGREKAMQNIKDIANLRVITSGQVPPNPTELIMNGKLERMLKEFKGEYDYIILDTPPIGLVTDAKILAPFSDITFYVIRHHHTPKSFLRFINNTYINEDFRNMYIVFNGLKERGMLGAKSAYGNGYGYGYGYGQGYQEEKTKAKNKLFSFFKRKQSNTKNKSV